MNLNIEPPPHEELGILNKTVDDNDSPWISGWYKNCAIKLKNNAYCKEYVRSGDTYSTHSPT